MGRRSAQILRAFANEPGFSRATHRCARTAIDFMLRLIELVSLEQISGVKEEWVSIRFGCVRFDDE
jgi:hypothetical protein